MVTFLPNAVQKLGLPRVGSSPSRRIARACQQPEAGGKQAICPPEALRRMPHTFLREAALKTQSTDEIESSYQK